VHKAIANKVSLHSRGLRDKLVTVARLVKKFLAFYGIRVSLQCPQEPGIENYLQPNESKNQLLITLINTT
jgi:hypothetical protein